LTFVGVGENGDDPWLFLLLRNRVGAINTCLPICESRIRNATNSNCVDFRLEWALGFEIFDGSIAARRWLMNPLRSCCWMHQQASRGPSTRSFLSFTPRCDVFLRFSQTGLVFDVPVDPQHPGVLKGHLPKSVAGGGTTTLDWNLSLAAGA
jgi:hypothetical protein